MKHSGEEPLHINQAIAHPGVLADERITAVETLGTSFTRRVRTHTGDGLFDVLSSVVESGGSQYGLIEFSDADLANVNYCVPAEGDHNHPMWYSDTLHSKRSRVLAGTATVGLRDQERWSHIHAVWKERDTEVLRAGHVWPETTVDEGWMEVSVVTFHSVALSYGTCAETELPVFEPSASSTSYESSGPLPNNASTSRFIVARIRPNVLIADAVHQLCEQFSVSQGRVRGGTGSLIGATFRAEHAPYHRVSAPAPASEVVYLRGDFDISKGADQINLRAGLVDKTATFFAGHLDPHANRVAITYDLVIEDMSHVSG